MEVCYKIFEWNKQMKSLILIVIAVIFVIAFVLLLVELSKNNNYYLRKSNEKSYRTVNKNSNYKFVKLPKNIFGVKRSINKNGDYVFIKNYKYNSDVRRSINRKQKQHIEKPVVEEIKTVETNPIRRIYK